MNKMSLSWIYAVGISILLTACGGSGSSSLIESLTNEYDQVEYFSVGDSTRAESGYGGQYLFYELYRELSQSGVDSHLMAQAGQSLYGFYRGEGYPTLTSVIYNIPNDGRNSIVNISLGINDAERSGAAIRQDLIASIRAIQRYRPQTHIVLTTPNRLYYDAQDTEKLRVAYHDAAQETGAKLIPLVDGLMSNPPASWYHDDGVHLSRSGQHEVAQFILGYL